MLTDYRHPESLTPQSLAALAEMLGEKLGVTVKRGSCWQANLETKEIFYPPSLAQLDKDSAVGLLIHELEHVVSSQTTSKKDYEMTRKAGKIGTDIINCLEDWRVDELASRRYPHGSHFVSVMHGQAMEAARRQMLDASYICAAEEHVAKIAAALGDTETAAKRILEDVTASAERTTDFHHNDPKSGKFGKGKVSVNEIVNGVQKDCPMLDVIGIDEEQLRTRIVPYMIQTNGSDSTATVKGWFRHSEAQRQTAAKIKEVLDRKNGELKKMGESMANKMAWELAALKVHNVLGAATLLAYGYYVPDPSLDYDYGSYEWTLQGWRDRKRSAREKELAKDLYRRAEKIAPTIEDVLELETTDAVAKYGDAHVWPVVKDLVPETDPPKDGGEGGGASGGKRNTGVGSRGTMKPDSVDPITNDYAAEREKVMQTVSTAKSRFRRIVQENAARRSTGRYRSGALAASKLHRAAVGDGRIFERPVESKDYDFAVSVLVDLSGSMYDGDDGAIGPALQACALVSESVSAVGGKVEIIGFSSETIRVARFGEKLDPRSISHGFDKVAGQGTDLGMALSAASKSLASVRSERKMCVAITDGGVAGCQSEFEKIAKGADTLCLLIGGGSEHMPDGMECVQVRDPDEMVPHVLSFLKKNIKRTA